MSDGLLVEWLNGPGATMPTPMLLGLLIVGTLVSEDLTCISAGLLVARGTLGFWPATLAALAGIFLGDLMLFAVGRAVGPAVTAASPLSRWLSADRMAAGRSWFDRHGPAILLLSRFTPGMRLPLYVLAGVLRLSAWKVSAYFAIGAVLWTPALVAVSAALGGRAFSVLEAHGRTAHWAVAGLAVGLWLAIRALLPLLTWRGRRRLWGRVQRIVRWEFWPPAFFYPPVVAGIAGLAVRHRGLTVFTAANPAIPCGGFVGESKSAILDGLAGSGEWVARYRVIRAGGSAEDRRHRLREVMEEMHLTFPFVLKPDQGQRGAGVAILRSAAQAEACVADAKGDWIVQEYAPGIEFGIFYVRHPDEPHGRIFSITEKRMPLVTGDGRRTLEELILADPRAVCMAEHHLRRHGDRIHEVVPSGESVPLVELGTHCRGAIFLNGWHILTPELEAAIDKISRGFRGFYFGRYDLRTPCVGDLMKGMNFRIVELNGVTSEATHIYDPSTRLMDAYRTLWRQWGLAFAIGAANRERGVAPSSFTDLLRCVRSFHRPPELRRSRRRAPGIATAGILPERRGNGRER